MIAATGVAALLALAAATAEAQTGEPVPYRTIDSGRAGDYMARTTFVIRDRRRYRHVWRRLQERTTGPVRTERVRRVMDCA